MSNSVYYCVEISCFDEVVCLNAWKRQGGIFFEEMICAKTVAVCGWFFEILQTFHRKHLD